MKTLSSCLHYAADETLLIQTEVMQGHQLNFNSGYSKSFIFMLEQKSQQIEHGILMRVCEHKDIASIPPLAPRVLQDSV